MEINHAIKRIILIDDDEDDLMFFDYALKAIDPAIELTHIPGPRQLPPDRKIIIPDILFLDINMPDWDGFQWLKFLREEGYVFPIVIYSTALNDFSLKKAYTEGAHLYYQKPSNTKDLIRDLKAILSLDWHAPQDIKRLFIKKGHFLAFKHTP